MFFPDKLLFRTVSVCVSEVRVYIPWRLSFILLSVIPRSCERKTFVFPPKAFNHSSSNCLSFTGQLNSQREARDSFWWRRCQCARACVCVFARGRELFRVSGASLSVGAQRRASALESSELLNCGSSAFCISPSHRSPALYSLKLHCVTF